MITYAASHAEFIALYLNALMTLAFIWQRDLPKVLYWGGATCVVLGVILMRSK